MRKIYIVTDSNVIRKGQYLSESILKEHGRAVTLPWSIMGENYPPYIITKCIGEIHPFIGDNDATWAIYGKGEMDETFRIICSSASTYLDDGLYIQAQQLIRLLGLLSEDDKKRYQPLIDKVEKILSDGITDNSVKQAGALIYDTMTEDVKSIAKYSKVELNDLEVDLELLLHNAIRMSDELIPYDYRESEYEMGETVKLNPHLAERFTILRTANAFEVFAYIMKFLCEEFGVSLSEVTK